MNCPHCRSKMDYEGRARMFSRETRALVESLKYRCPVCRAFFYVDGPPDAATPALVDLLKKHLTPALSPLGAEREKTPQYNARRATAYLRR